MLGEPLFCWGVGLGLVMPLGQFLPNVAVGLLASVRVLYARNWYTIPCFCLAHEIIEWRKKLYPPVPHSPPRTPICLILQGQPCLAVTAVTAVLRFPRRERTAFCGPVPPRALVSRPVELYGGAGPLRTLRQHAEVDVLTTRKITRNSEWLYGGRITLRDGVNSTINDTSILERIAVNKCHTGTASPSGPARLSSPTGHGHVNE